MSTTKTTKTSNQYDPASTAAYQNLIKGGSSVLSGYMNNPFGNPAYTMGLQNSMRGATQQGANNMGVLNQQLRTSGMASGGGNAFQMAQMGRVGRANASLLSQANIGNVQGALNRQFSAAGQGLAFQPLQTGQTATQKTSGLGTWLPQVAGMALGGLTGGLGGALGGMFGGGGGSGAFTNPSLMAGPAAPPNPFMLPSNAFQPYPSF
jgi:hypothetical protein